MERFQRGEALENRLDKLAKEVSNVYSIISAIMLLWIEFKDIKVGRKDRTL